MGLRNVELEQFLKKYNTEDLLSGILEMQMCSYKHLIDERIPAAEYIASNVIRYNISDSNNSFTWNDFIQLLEFARNIYSCKRQYKRYQKRAYFGYHFLP